MLYSKNVSVRGNLAALYVAFIISLVSLFGNAFPAFAQGTAGVGVRPAIISEKMDPGETRQFTVQLNNLSGTDQTYYLSRRDIVGVREGGVPIFASDTTERTGYEISDWITLDRTELFIPAGGTDSLNFVLTVPEGASPGSHFGSIIVSVEPPEIRNSGASIGYEVANIVSIRIAGEAVDRANIREFSTSQYVYGTTNVDFEARVENEGNTLVSPYGPLEVYNMFGKKVTTLNFNDSQAGVYPKTAFSDGMRTFSLNWQDEAVGFGRYEAVLALTYGDEGRKNTMSSTVTFWILPMNIIGPALAILAVLLIVVYVSIRIYVRRSVAMLSAGNVRRLVRTRQRNQFPVVLLMVTMLTVTALFLIILLLLFA
jgi:hypothetical protein